MFVVRKPRGKHQGRAKTVLSTLIHKDWLRLGIGPCMGAIGESTTCQWRSSECLPTRVAVSKKEVQGQENGQSSWSMSQVAP